MLVIQSAKHSTFTMKRMRRALSSRIPQKNKTLSGKRSPLILKSLNLPRRKFNAQSHAVLTFFFFASLNGLSLKKRPNPMEQQKHGMPQKAFIEHTELSWIFTYGNPLDYLSLEACFLFFVWVQEAFYAGSNRNSFTPKEIIHRPDVSQSKTRNRALAFASRFSDLTMTVRCFRTAAVSSSWRTSDMDCFYSKGLGQFSTNCPKNEHRKTRCISCGKLNIPCIVSLKSRRQSRRS